jgi:hypothetical protein
MKLDYSTNPPTAWSIEDGYVVSIDQRDVMQCTVCQKYFVNTNLFNRTPICSTGCRLKKQPKVTYEQVKSCLSQNYL